MKENFESLFQELESTISKIVELQVQKELNIHLSQNSNKKKYYNLKELEEITSISRDALKGRIRRGTLKATKDGNIILVPTKEVDRLLNKLKYNLPS